MKYENDVDTNCSWNGPQGPEDQKKTNQTTKPLKSVKIS